MRFERVFSHYENIVGIKKDGDMVFISPRLLEKTNFKGKLKKKRTRTWLE